MRKPLLALTLILLLVLTQLIASAPLRRSMRAQLSPNYVRALTAYRRLETWLPREELRAITAIGVLNGAKQAEEQMERNLVEVIKDLLFNTDMSDDDELIAKVERIEQQLVRDQRALSILTSAMDLVTGVKDVRDFKAQMQQTLQQIRRQSTADEAETHATTEAENAPDGANVSIVLLTGSQEADAQQLDKEDTQPKDTRARIGALRRQILKQVREMKTLMEQKITQTLDYLIAAADEDSLLAQASNKVVRKRDASQALAQDLSQEREDAREVPAEIRMLKSILTEADFRHNLVETPTEKRQDEQFDSLEDDEEFTLAPQTKNVIANRSSGRSVTKTATTNTTRAAATTTTTKSAASTKAGATTTPAPKKSATKSLGTRAAPVDTTTIAAALARLTTQAAAAVTSPTDVPQLAKQEEALPESGEDDIGGDDADGDGGGGGGGGGGGLVGIVSGLSGGEGGSDIGALIGALTGVISQLFGPGGLDIESLIGTATSLISGLLAGNKNFGIVLGGYVGTALDGLSGGGGAINNGQFIGNFLGTVVASLSADPEGENGGLKPFLFARNVINSFLDAKNRKDSDEEGDDERRSDKGGEHSYMHSYQQPKGGASKPGSDSGAFIKHIVSHLVSSALSVILNASLGASGGASHASASLFSHLSHHTSKPSAAGDGGGGVKTW